MTKLLLDTCAILYVSSDHPKVTGRVRQIFKETEEIFVSAISVVELACLCQKGRIDLGMHWKPWFRKAVELNGWQVLDLNWEIMEEAYSLPDTFHADPADRMLVATARFYRIPFLTTDRRILEYPHVNAFWEERC